MRVNTRHINSIGGIYILIYLVFTRMPGESYCRRLRSLLLCLCNVIGALINSPLCWLRQQQKQKSLRFIIFDYLVWSWPRTSQAGAGDIEEIMQRICCMLYKLFFTDRLWDIQARLHFRPYVYDMPYRLPLNKLRTPLPQSTTTTKVHIILAEFKQKTKPKRKTKMVYNRNTQLRQAQAQILMHSV